MANAAAKKAAAARQTATSIYQPILLILEAVYAYFRMIRHWETWTIRPILITCLFWIMTYFCYQGILLDHENRVSMTSAKTLDNKNRNNKHPTQLAGGIYLDILALVLLIQFGSLWKEQVLWFILIFPIWGVYSLYQTFLKGMMIQDKIPSQTSSSSTSSNNPDDDPTVEEKRRKRAERRRQKWS